MRGERNSFFIVDSCLINAEGIRELDKVYLLISIIKSDLDENYLYGVKRVGESLRSKKSKKYFCI